MASRPKHQRKEIEREFRKMERAGWIIAKPGPHFKLKCPNACKCLLVTSATPSGGNPLRIFAAQRTRMTCWKED